jgi:uncharacterized damage-inducible protein DinB
MAKPDLATVPSFYHKYIQQIGEDDLVTALRNNTGEMLSFLSSIPEEKWNHRYAEGKWSIKEMIQHIIDAERIFAYRALCFARGEKASLPGFEEDDYAAASNADKRTKNDLLNELTTVRKSIELLYQSFDKQQLEAFGTANNNPVSVNAIGFIIPGHVKHHLNILKERYLVP